MRAYTRPLIVSSLGSPDQVCRALEDLPMKPGKGEGSYNELWLQALIHRHPALLPVSEIEPGLSSPVPVCMELVLPSGRVDNLLVTPDGGIVVVETKLWRNPEARREVIGQILDYAKDLSRYSYEELQRQVRMVRKDPGLSLFTLVCPNAEPEAEPAFVDAVSRNLRLGRFLLIIAGDGVQESAEQLSDFLQRHIGLHFTLAMVEMSLWRAPGSGEVLVQPRILARTVQIERAVVRIEAFGSHNTATIEPVSPASSRPLTLSAETFYEQLAAAEAQAPARLKVLLDKAVALGVRGDVAKGMRLKWVSQSGRDVALGNIDVNGRLFTDTVHLSAEALGRGDLGRRYKQALAVLIPGATIEPAPEPQGLRLVRAGSAPHVWPLLDQPDGWLQAIGDYIEALARATGEDA